MWAKLGQFTIDAIALNFPTELDSTDCDQIFKVAWCKQFKYLVLGNIKYVFTRFVFIQANIFFLKLKGILTKTDISCAKS